MAQLEPTADAGFLSRWSQRKQALRSGQSLPEPPRPPAVANTENFKKNQPVALKESAPSAHEFVAKEAEQTSQEAQTPAPTMRDVHTLTPQSDFKPFMRADVDPQVKNAAMKQLFKDPHFNTMDMMDVYVDDYSKPDPLPPEMLRKMAVTKFLGFWDDEEKEAAEKKAREDAGDKSAQNVAQSESVTNEEKPATPLQELAASPAALAPASDKPHTHDDSDLQLQPDDAAGRKAPFSSTG